MFFYGLTISVFFLSLFFPNWLLWLGFLYYLFFIIIYFIFICKTNLISLHVRYFKIGFSYSLKMEIVIYMFVKFGNLARICLSVWTNSYRQTRANPRAWTDPIRGILRFAKQFIFIWNKVFYWIVFWKLYNANVIRGKILI